MSVHAVTSVLRWIGCLLLALTPGMPAAATAGVVEYAIRLSFHGATGPYALENGSCPGADPGASNEVITGTVRGDESASAADDEIVYSGVLDRRTALDICDVKQTADGDDYCVTHLGGQSKVRLKITINFGRKGAWIQWEPVAGMARAQAGGTCDSSMTADIQNGYATGSDIADMDTVPGEPLRKGRSWTQSAPRNGGGVWKLEVLSAGSLHADPGGPYSPQRADQVTLDGSRSRPGPGHRIDDYQWELTPLGNPAGCTGIGKPTTASGVTTSFIALCSFRARLTVHQDDGDTDSSEVEITVRPRRWKTEFTTDATARHDKSFSFTAGVPSGAAKSTSKAMAFGYNRCRRIDAASNREHFDEDSNHWYEPHPGSVNDYEEGTYWLDQVQDGGPFDGVYYVSRGDFAIERAIWLNKRFYAPGDVEFLNSGPGRQVDACTPQGQRCAFGKPTFARLLQVEEAHERMHSTLAEKALRKLAKDPAVEVESGLSLDRATLKQSVNQVVAGAVSAMSNASTEDQVKAEVRKIPAFAQGGCIDFPDWDGAIRGCYYYIDSFADRVE